MRPTSDTAAPTDDQASRMSHGLLCQGRRILQLCNEIGSAEARILGQTAASALHAYPIDASPLPSADRPASLPNRVAHPLKETPLKLRRNMHPRALCIPRAANVRNRQASGWLLAGLGLLAAALWLASTTVVRAESNTSGPTTDQRHRVDLLLDPAGFPEGDRARSVDRMRAMAEAKASGLPLFRSFEPRETIRETLAILEEKGVNLGPSAIVNFDSIEASMSAETRREVGTLPFIRKMRKPAAPVPAGLWDSEGIELTYADLAHFGATAPPITGAGISVAIIDTDYQVLGDTMASLDDELYAIPVTNMWKQKSSGSDVFENKDLDNFGSREHGSASAELVYEMAPNSDIYLYGVRSTAGIEWAIDHAAAQGYDVIVIPLTHIETMSDPVSNLSGGTNRFTDNIDAATLAGSVVVVAAGNEAKRHLNDEYQACEECVSGHPDYICNDANDNDQFHKFEDPFDELPLNALTWDDDHYDAENFTLTCWSAIEAGFDETKFRMQLYEFDEGSENDEPLCPGDSGAVPVPATQRNLGGFFEKPISLFDANFDEHYFYLAVEYTDPGTPLPDWPNFRIACGTGVDEFLFMSTPGSLSDLAVVESAITVAEVDAFFEDEVTETSSHGPAASGPQKPEVGGPGTVENFAVQEFDFVGDWVFKGTSASAVSVGSIVALMQEFRVSKGMEMLTQDEARTWLQNSALDIEDPGVDDKVGHGLVQVPTSIYEGDAGPLEFFALPPCRLIDTRNDPGPSGGPSEPLQPGQDRRFMAAGSCGIPSSARAISGILSVVAPSANGFIALYPADELRPTVSSVNFRAGGVTNNNTFLKLSYEEMGTGPHHGAFRAYTPVGTSHLILDVNGYFQ